jgi:hypothetical protein
MQGQYRVSGPIASALGPKDQNQQPDGTRLAQVPIMIASSGFGLLALFSLLSVLLGGDGRRNDDPFETTRYASRWTR